ncbi:MAG: hypothetical protein GY772_29035, partial [bacterium]|nr:hypothetical protein [bacterium]
MASAATSAAEGRAAALARTAATAPASGAGAAATLLDVLGQLESSEKLDFIELFAGDASISRGMRL